MRKTGTQGRHYIGAPTKPPKVKKMKYRILLIRSDDNEWYWLYTIGKRSVARSGRTYPKLADASRAARTFRELLAHADVCEICPPEGYVYSGG